MNISEFFQEHTCPSCGKELTLFLRARHNSLWKATDSSPNGYTFTQHLIKNQKFGENDSFILNVDGNFNRFHCNSSALWQEFKSLQFFLFYICNEKAIIKEFSDYKISSVDSCYVRNSTFLELGPQEWDNDKVLWSLIPVSKESPPLVRNENFGFTSKTSENGEKGYFYTLDYDGKKSILYYYAVTSDQLQEQDFEPKVFEQTELPLPPVRPDFSNKEKIMSKLDNWILLS